MAQSEYVIKKPLHLLKLSIEQVCYDVESLFTSILFSKTIDISSTNTMNISQFVFCQLLEKLTENCVFTMNNKYIKQIESCPMGVTISVVMPVIHIDKMQEKC